jgi:hypothetical protein
MATYIQLFVEFFIGHEFSHVHLFVDTPAPALKAAPVPEWKEVRKRSRERRSLPKDMGESSLLLLL